MRQLSALIAAASIIAFTQVVSAADLPTKTPVYKAPIIAPVYNWTGFYVGLNIGGSWGHQGGALVDTVFGDIATSSANLDGVIGGGQIGYNWQVNQWVFGVEADFQGSGQRRDVTLNTAPTTIVLPIVGAPGIPITIPGSSTTYTDKLDWFGTVRGRVGWAMDRWLPYVTGGWAYGHGGISGTRTFTTLVSTLNASQNYSGWTAGGGVEWAFANNWSAKLEYLYIDFGNGPTIPLATALNFSARHMTDNVVRAGLNYKFY